MAVQCGVCLDYCSLGSEGFSIFPCGHGFCTGCISRLFSEPQSKCPNCRVLLHEEDAHPVHINFIDAQTFLQNSVVDGLNQMGASTSLKDINEVSQNLGRISGDSKADISLLVRAVEDFKERLAPVFTKVDTQKEEIDNLWGLIRRLQQDNIEILQDNSTKIKPWRAEVVRSKKAVDVQKGENDKLRDLLRELLREKEVLQVKLKKMPAEVLRAVDIQKEQNVELRDELRRLRQDKGILQGKLKKMESEVVRSDRAVNIQKGQNDELKGELRQLRRDKEFLQGKVKKMGPLEDEVERLKTTLSETKQYTGRVLAKLEAKSIISKERETVLEQENARYTNKVQLQEVKNKKLRGQVTALMASQKEAASTDVSEHVDGT